MRRAVAWAKPRGRQGIWAAVRKLADDGFFTISDIVRETDIVAHEIKYFLDALADEGILKREKAPGIFRNNYRGSVRYTLLRDVGREAPVVGRPAKLRDTLWRTMKHLSASGDFSLRDLAIAARVPGLPVTEHEARKYVAGLIKAKYAVETTTRRFRLIENTGPSAPIVERLGAVFDPNRNGIIWHEEPGL